MSRGSSEANLLLKKTVEISVSPEEFRRLEGELEVLGNRIFGWFVRKLSAVRVGDPHTEAEDLFQQFCLKVEQRLRRQGGEVVSGWFWAVANSALLSHLSRVLAKQKMEVPIDGILDLMTGTRTVEQVDAWPDDRIDELVQRCLKRLPARMREFLHLDLVERRPREQIVSLMGLAPKSYAANKAKAIRKLRDEIFREFGRRS